MSKPESKSSILFRHWLMAHPRESCTFEMKDTRGDNALAFSEIKKLQIEYGLAVKYSSKGVLFRMQSVSEGMPDYSYHYKDPAYVVIKYPSVMCLIDIEALSLEKGKSVRRS